MSSLNKVTLIGNLGKDPEVRYFESGAVKTNFPLATSERYKNKAGELVENTDWHNVVLWRSLAQLAEKYLRKGSKVYIEGRIKTRSYDDKDGNKRYITEIEATSMILLDRKEDIGDGESQPFSQPNMSSTPTSPASNTSNPQEVKVADNSAFEDDLPF